MNIEQFFCLLNFSTLLQRKLIVSSRKKKKETRQIKYEIKT